MALQSPSLDIGGAVLVTPKPTPAVAATGNRSVAGCGATRSR